MRFLQKFFSLGSRKSKKKRTQLDTEIPPVPDLQRQYDIHEETVSRFLRSSSANLLAATAEVDYNPLPPPSHPFQHTFSHFTSAASSTASLGSASQRGTYTVKVYPRTLHARTEFPNANPPMRQDSLTPRRTHHGSLRRRSKSVPITPRDKIRLFGLRQDPSVASLLDLYDEHGCLDSKVFSNSPPSSEQVQVCRNKSTLRQLLGNPPSQSSRRTQNNDAVEGDISWAERYLCESADSSTSSLGVQTPNDALFPDTHFNHDHKNTTTALHDITINNSDSYPAISSLEVELSMTTESHPVPTPNYPYQSKNLLTPQRASQVFDFLTAKKPQNRDQPEERTLLALAISANPSASRFSSDTSVGGSHESHIPLTNDTPMNLDAITEPRQPHDMESTNGSVYNPASSKWPSDSNWLEPTASTNYRGTSTTSSRNILHAGPKLHKVVVVSATDAQANRNLRGPRPLSRLSTKPNPTDQYQQTHQNVNKLQDSPKAASRSNLAATSAPDLSMSNDADPFILQPTRKYHRRIPICSSTSHGHQVPDRVHVAPTKIQPIPKEDARRKSPVHDKENDNQEAVFCKARLLPMTPVRSRAVFRAPNGMTPSPVSSSDLSPVAQQLMADLRTQRMRARERERKNGRWGSTTSKLKW